ncbi:MAG: hypothetical protein HRU38_26040 [Saccharospirillaceae bacterium]|nr:hypothetical protein [Saccharospirillaceae bacterium]
MTTRQLTQEEIDNAPEWATHYQIYDERENICFESEDFYQFIPNGVRKDNTIGLEDESIPIPRKEKSASEAELIHKEVCRIAEYLYKKFYSDVKGFELLEGTSGVLSQIDNMLTGLTKK